MTSTSTMEKLPVIAAGERIIPAADNRNMMRRLSDRIPPSEPLDWSQGGTPLEGTSVVHFYRPVGDRFECWAEIRTQEQLLSVKQEPERFVLWTLFTIPVDELSRSPLSLVAAAATKLDVIRAATGAVIANMRAFAREIGEQP